MDVSDILKIHHTKKNTGGKITDSKSLWSSVIIAAFASSFVRRTLLLCFSNMNLISNSRFLFMKYSELQYNFHSSDNVMLSCC